MRRVMMPVIRRNRLPWELMLHWRGMVGFGDGYFRARGVGGVWVVESFFRVGADRLRGFADWGGLFFDCRDDNGSAPRWRGR
jgi:hypothetical protein